MKASDFEGENSSLKRAFDGATSKESLTVEPTNQPEIPDSSIDEVVEVN